MHIKILRPPQTSFLVACLVIFFSNIASANNNNDYVFILKGRGNVFWKVIQDGIRETALENNINPIIYNTDDDQTPEAQLNICLTAIQRKPKLIVLGAATKSVGITCFKKSQQNGILFADIDGNVTVQDAKEAGLTMSFSVASNNQEIGRLAGLNASQLFTKPDPKILVLKGLTGSIVSEDRANGFIKEIKEKLPNAVIIATPTTDWDRLKAMNITNDYLQREKEIDLIYSVSDAMSLGVVEALRLAKKDKTIKLISVDGIADGRKAILKDQIAFNVAQLPFLMGKRAVELAVNTTNTKLESHVEYIATPVLTKSVLEANAEPELKYLR